MSQIYSLLREEAEAYLLRAKKKKGTQVIVHNDDVYEKFKAAKIAGDTLEIFYKKLSKEQ